MSAQILVAAVAVIVSVGAFGSTRRRDVVVRRAELLRAYTNDFYADAAMSALFLDLEYGRTSYELVRKTSHETSLVRLLDLLNSVGHSARVGIIRRRDLLDTTLGYACVVAWGSAVVTEFLLEVDEVDARERLDGQGFAHFRWLAATLHNTYQPTAEWRASR